MDLTQYQNILNGITANNTTTQNGTTSSSVNLVTPNGTVTFTIVNKTIQVPVALDDLLIQGDVNSRKIHFKMNRYFDGIDLSTKDIFINYQNAKLETGYDSTYNLVVDTDIIEFDYLVNGKLTTAEGQDSIQVEICEYDQSGDVIYRYQTRPIELVVKKTVISKGDADPTDYYLDIQFLNQNSTPIIYNGMVSTTIPINIENRTIVMPSLNDIAVTQDCRSKLLTFKIKRFIDNIDLSLKTICIKYILTNGTGDRSFACNHVITDAQIQFDWLLDSKVTSLEGKVEFAIEFIGYNEKNEFYCYNTLPSYIFISKGLEVDSVIEQPSASWIQTWNILADSYLRDYIRYVNQINDNADQAMENAAQAVIAMQQAKASEVSAQNDAGIAWQQADRAERMANISAGYNQTVQATMNKFQNDYSNFYSEYTNLRKKDEPISKIDLSPTLIDIIDNKAEKIHTHLATDITQDNDHKFVNDTQLSLVDNARQKTVPITENDLDANLVTKINSGGTGTGGGIIISGAQIDDTSPSFSKVYSSKTTENKINTAIGSAISGLNGLSDNNFTDEEKQKLARIEDNANYFTLTSINASIVDETDLRKFVSNIEKANYADKYTKAEIDNMISSITSGIIWKADVPTFEDIAKTYPKPVKNWATSLANGDTYYYDGTSWVKIGSGKTPLSTNTTNGLMSSADKVKLDMIESGANKYIHPATHSANMITETNDKNFVTKIEKEAIDNLNITINNNLKDYRKSTVKILETDLDQTLIDKLSNAGGLIINDAVSSTSQTYSSAVIDKKINDVINDVATEADIDALFT